MKMARFLTSWSLNLVEETDMRNPIWPRTQNMPNKYLLNKYEKYGILLKKGTPTTGRVRVEKKQAGI